MDINVIVTLAIYFLIATIIKIATDNTAEIVKPFWDLTRYKLVIAFIFTIACIFGLNQGILEVLGVDLENSRFWFHTADMILFSLFLAGGAQKIHQLADSWTDYRKRKVD